jgi:hypothetical protein
MRRDPAPWPVLISDRSEYRALTALVAPCSVTDDEAMKFSTRNQLPGTVDSVTLGEAMAVVRSSSTRAGC